PGVGNAAFRGFELPPALIAQVLAHDLGALLLALAVLGLAAGGARVLQLGMLVVAAAGFVIALRPAVPRPHALLTRVLPGFPGIRAPGRFLVICVLAASVLAGMGAAALRRAVAARLGGAAGAAALVVIGAAVVLGSRPPAPLPVIARGPDAPTFAAARWL